MTFAWYWHLKQTEIPLWKVILISWGLALAEYCLAVPANRYGFMSGWNGFQLKIVQEVNGYCLFGICGSVSKRAPGMEYAVSFFLLLGAVYFAFK